MYSLPQSGLSANKLLEKQLNKPGCRQSKLVHGLWGRHMASTIHFGCWQLWSKICWSRTCQSLQTGSGRTLHTHVWLDWNTLHRHHIRLELHKTPGPLVNAKVCDKSAKTIPTHRPKTPICTIPMRLNSVRCQKNNTQRRNQKHPY